MRTDAPALPDSPAGSDRRVFAGPTMGTRYALICYSPAATDLAALDAALAGAVKRVDAQMSTWKPKSDLMRFNAAPVGEWVDLPPELMEVLAAALRVGRLTGGAFEIAVGDLVSAWGFAASPRAAKERRLALSERTLPAAHLTLDLDLVAGRARKTSAVALDLSGIAKGFAVDELARVATRFGLANHLASIDGEVRATGRKPDGSAWMVALEKPIPGQREAEGVIALEDASLATSGDYRHFAEVEGRIVSHTIDPRTRLPLANGVASVTVRAQSCMEADAWATAMMVLGLEAGETLAAANGIEALFVMRG